MCLLIGANVAYLRPTWSYPPRPSDGGDNSHKAVDGDTSTSYANGGCSHTGSQEYLAHDPWLVVELDNIYSVYSVDLTNRGDCCGKCKVHVLMTALHTTTMGH